jgi:prepilin-type processing-associated H-X9-DG protein
MGSSLNCPHCGAAVVLGGTVCMHCGKEIGTPPRWQFISRALSVLFAIIAALIVVGLMLPAVGGRPAPQRALCANNMRQLGLAMLMYHEKNGRFPPAFVADKNGKPMHSWRTLLLPYLESELGDKYNFDEPWDSPSNRKVTDVPLAVFRCPSEPGGKQPTTSYMMVVGPHTISDGPHSKRSKDITDNEAQTIMLVEVADSGVRWAEPKDLEFDQIDFKINGTTHPGISSHHRGGVNIVFADGHVSSISTATPPELIKAMLTINGSEKIRDEDLLY